MGTGQVEQIGLGGAVQARQQRQVRRAGSGWPRLAAFDCLARQNPLLGASAGPTLLVKDQIAVKGRPISLVKVSLVQC